MLDTAQNNYFSLPDNILYGTDHEPQLSSAKLENLTQYIDFYAVFVWLYNYTHAT